MAYLQVNIGAIKAAETEGDYEDPDKLARYGRRGRETIAPIQDSASPYELPVSASAESTPACAYATADEVGRSWRDTKIVDSAAETSQ